MAFTMLARIVKAIVVLTGLAGIGFSLLGLYISIIDAGIPLGMIAAIPIFFLIGIAMLTLGLHLKKSKTVLVNCRECGKIYSRNSLVYPQCGNNRNQRPASMAPCRVCGALLQKNKHRYLSGSITNTISKIDVNTGNVTYGVSAWHEHVPCSKCGEPKPLRRLVDVMGGPLASVWITFPFSILAAFTSVRLKVK